VLDLLDLLGAEVIGVDQDDEGISLAGLEAALAAKPSMVFLQPRAQNPTGTSLSTRRARAAAKLIGRTSAVVVEDDHSGDIASSELHSLGRWIPTQVVHIRSFSKSHGPDLRLAAVGGAGSVIDAVTTRRLIGPGWSSRLLQAVLLAMLDDPTTIATIEAARETYAQRRGSLATALAERAIPTGGGDGINLWVPVADEQAALVGLAARGVGVAPGTPFQVRPDADHIRITAGLIRGGPQAAERLADQIAGDAQGAARPPTQLV
jgi:DNA-binding transcriptional MocR family regulator